MYSLSECWSKAWLLAENAPEMQQSMAQVRAAFLPHMGGLDRIPGSRLWPRPGRQMEDPSFIMKIRDKHSPLFPHFQNKNVASGLSTLNTPTENRFLEIYFHNSWAFKVPVTFNC